MTSKYTIEYEGSVAHVGKAELVALLGDLSLAYKLDTHKGSLVIYGEEEVLELEIQ